MSKHTDRRRVLIVTELFYPEESATAFIMGRIAAHLAAQHSVLVITGPESYEGVAQRIASADLPNAGHITVERVSVPKLDKNRLAQRALRFVLLGLGLAWLTLKRARATDSVLAVTNPAPLIVLLALVKRVRGFRLSLLVHDVFPENAIATGIIKQPHKLPTRLARWLFNRAYAAASQLIVIGRDMAEVVAAKVGHSQHPPAISIVENWAELDDIRPLARDASLIGQWGHGERVVIQYAGNIGRAQGILPIAEIMHATDNPQLHCVFIGSGAMKPALDQFIAAREPQRLSTRPAYKRSEQQLILNSCDLALVVLGQGMYGLGVPSKTYNIMAAGKPVLYIGPRDSEIYRLVREHQIGWAFAWDEQQALHDLLAGLGAHALPELQCMGERARQLAEQRFSESVAMRKMEAAVLGQTVI